MIESTYHAEWQNSRIDFILTHYKKEFFEGKRILELAPYNGYIGYRFSELGAKVHGVEGRETNVENIRNTFPMNTVECANLDTPDWLWGKWDIIINFGLYYHLEKYHKEHLVNCIQNCKLMFFETIVLDSYDSEIQLRPEEGDDQSLSDVGGVPSTSYVEDIFKEYNVEFTKYSSPQLNGGRHKYDWQDTNSKVVDYHSRRFWIVNT